MKAVRFNEYGDASVLRYEDVDRPVPGASQVLVRVAATSFNPLDMPLVLTSSLEDQAQGPLLKELAEIAPEEFANRVQRVGVVNAMDDPNFFAAVKATNRPNLIIAGVTNDVCTVYPTLTALDEGYRVQVVADAGGSMSKSADDVALRRMELAGASITSANMILTELARNWASPAGERSSRSSSSSSLPDAVEPRPAPQELVLAAPWRGSCSSEGT